MSRMILEDHDEQFFCQQIEEIVYITYEVRDIISIAAVVLFWVKFEVFFWVGL